MKRQEGNKVNFYLIIFLLLRTPWLLMNDFYCFEKLNTINWLWGVRLISGVSFNISKLNLLSALCRTLEVTLSNQKIRCPQTPKRISTKVTNYFRIKSCKTSWSHQARLCQSVWTNKSFKMKELGWADFWSFLENLKIKIKYWYGHSLYIILTKQGD